MCSTSWPPFFLWCCCYFTISTFTCIKGIYFKTSRKDHTLRKPCNGSNNVWTFILQRNEKGNSSAEAYLTSQQEEKAILIDADGYFPTEVLNVIFQKVKGVANGYTILHLKSTLRHSAICKWKYEEESGRGLQMMCIWFANLSANFFVNTKEVAAWLNPHWLAICIWLCMTSLTREITWTFALYFLNLCTSLIWIDL